MVKKLDDLENKYHRFIVIVYGAHEQDQASVEVVEKTIVKKISENMHGEKLSDVWLIHHVGRPKPGVITN